MPRTLGEVINFHKKAAASYDNWLLAKFVNDVTWDFMTPYLPESKAVILDAGGGTGLFAVPLAEKGHKVVVVDVCKDMLDILRAKLDRSDVQHNIDIREDDIRDLSQFESESFDLVLCLNDPISMSYPNHETAFSEIVRVARKGAAIILSVKNKARYLYDSIGDLIEKFNTVDYDKRLEKTRSLDSLDFMKFKEMPVQTFTSETLKQLFLKNHVRVLRIASTPVLIPFGSITPDDIEKFLSLKQNYDFLLEMEKRCYKLPDFLGLGLELMAVGIKE